MNLKKYILLPAAAVLLLASSSCVKETFPENYYMTTDQVETQANAMQGFINAINGQMATTALYTDSYLCDIGYPGLSMMRDTFVEDFPVFDNSYDHFSYYATNTYLGEYATSDWPWVLYYKYIGAANNVLRTEQNEENALYFGFARFYRAMFYFDLARMYEYKDTGFAALDGQAQANDIYGLTVPIIRENTTEAEARNMPRAPYYEMYSFILSELKESLSILEGQGRISPTSPDEACVYGELARVYLDLASRFDKKPQSIDEAKAAGFDLGIASANAAYRLAADCARKAISLAGTPMDQATWQSTGFNTVSTPSWMLGISINKELLCADSWHSWVAFMCPETLYGISGLSNSTGELLNTYAYQHLISTDLYSRIPDSDWRKLTWIAPQDAGVASAKSKYASPVSNEFFKQIPALASLKFRPRNNELTDYTVGSAVDFPLMRVEEMYFILAEALANAEGVGSGASQLAAFLNSYRYTDGSYICYAESLEGFRRELMVQKRIEFWGEGILAWDYKRLDFAVTRGYEGSNFQDSYMLNSNPGYTAPWLNFYIMNSEIGKNQAMKPNPDPSIVNCVWSGN